ncbi:phytanoyl-CoA dioxygenase [Hyaloraphidium curvatum]|nr:phytanoyl-CoA dioxygenase [Hyaloraphidium curvatum]
MSAPRLAQLASHLHPPALPETLGAGYGREEAEMRKYVADGTARAMALGNRGPLRFTPSGDIHPDILEAYSRCGFYVFEDVLSKAELEDIEAGFKDFLSRLPVKKGAEVDSRGRKAIGVGCTAPTTFWAKPLSDPNGGTQAANGRYPVKMYEPPSGQGDEEVCVLVLGSLQFFEAQLRAYAHPGILKFVEAVNGKDFAPFNEALWIKEPGKGASTAWHQDGVTHWGAPGWDQDTHGFNCMAQLYGCNASNAVWVVPGSHKLGKVDIKAWIDRAGTERLPDAVPIVCGPGGVAVTNRQAVHGSFANTSTEWRVTLNYGFHRRSSVLDVYAGGVHNAPAKYDAERIRRRSRVIGYAIDARRQKYPDEEAYVYAPHAENGERYRWDDAARADMHDYNLEDLSI